jgi:hypothetical protein
MEQPETSDPITVAFPDDQVCSLAHQVVGEALVALVDHGVSLDDARAILRAGIEAVIAEYEV